jgi:hypothetical protein
MGVSTNPTGDDSEAHPTKSLRQYQKPIRFLTRTIVPAMSHDQREKFRTELLTGKVSPEFYQHCYLPYANGVQTRAIETLQRVSRGKVTASVLLGAKQAAAPLTYRALADSVAVMSAEQIQQLVAQVFDSVPTT